MRFLTILTAIILTASASASMIEDAVEPTGLTYQEDAHIHGDAPDTCETADLSRVVNLDANETFGMLVQTDDESDVYAMPIAPDTAGQRVQLTVIPRVGVEIYDLSFDVFDPDCGYSVFDEDAPIYQEPVSDVPVEPFTPDAGSAAYSSTPDSQYSCNSAEWKILVKETKGDWADTMFIEWTDGNYTYVPVHHGNPSNTAKYLTSHDLDSTIKRIVVVMDESWNGSVQIAHGPCDVSDDTWVAPPAPARGTLTGKFTPVTTGNYIVQVSIAKDAVEKTTETAQGIIDNPPTTLRVDCHYTVCTIITSEASYSILSTRDNAA